MGFFKYRSLFINENAHIKYTVDTNREADRFVLFCTLVHYILKLVRHTGTDGVVAMRQEVRVIVVVRSQAHGAAGSDDEAHFVPVESVLPTAHAGRRHTDQQTRWPGRGGS